MPVIDRATSSMPPAGHPLGVTVSVSVVERGLQGSTVSAFDRADRALYWAKEGGRSRVAVG